MTDLRAAYLQSRGERCPFCPSVDLETAAFRLGRGGGDQPVKCVHCKSEWIDHYLLIDFDVVVDTSTPVGRELADDARHPHILRLELDEDLENGPTAELVLLVSGECESCTADSLLDKLREAVMGWMEDLPLGTPLRDDDNARVAVNDLIFNMVNDGGFADEGLVSRMKSYGLVYVDGRADQTDDEFFEDEDEAEDEAGTAEFLERSSRAEAAGWVPRTLHFVSTQAQSPERIGQVNLLAHRPLSEDEVLERLANAITAWARETEIGRGAIEKGGGDLTIGEVIAEDYFFNSELAERMMDRGLCVIQDMITDTDSMNSLNASVLIPESDTEAG